MKRLFWLFGIVLILIIVGIKNFTMILDDKDSAIEISKTYQWEQDYSDKRKLGKAVKNIFIGEVVELSGTKNLDKKPYTLYSVRITQNIKGGFIDDIIVAQEGGYYKENGKLYLLKYEDEDFLKPGSMYLFASTPNSNKEWQQIVPVYGSTLIKNEEQKYKLIDEYKAALEL